MTKEQFLDKWNFGSHPLFEPDLDAVIAYEITKAKGELYTESEAEQVTEPAKPKFDKDRFEAMFRAVVSNSGHELEHNEAIKLTEEALEKLDAFYETKEKGGENE